MERNVPTGEAPLALKTHSKHESGDQFVEQLRKISLRDKFRHLNQVNSDIEMRIQLAKRARELSHERTEKQQFDFVKEKSIPITVK